MSALLSAFQIPEVAAASAGFVVGVTFSCVVFTIVWVLM